MKIIDTKDTKVVIRRYEVRGTGDFLYIKGEIWARSEDFALRCFAEMAGLKGNSLDCFLSTVNIKIINSQTDI